MEFDLSVKLFIGGDLSLFRISLGNIISVDNLIHSFTQIQRTQYNKQNKNTEK